jgi:hypothetical protein
MQQRRPHLLFELTYLQAQRRLLDSEPSRRPGEVPLLGDRHEIAQMPEFHDDYHTQTVSKLLDPYIGCWRRPHLAGC